MRATVLAAASLLAPLVAEAQVPPPSGTKLGTPSVPVNRLPIEVVSVKPYYVIADVTYERAGLKPREYRHAASAQAVSSAAWQPFTEGAITTKVVNGVTVTVGKLQALNSGANCAPGKAWNKVFLQFRTRDLQGNVFVSNVKGDSTCAGSPG